MSPRTNAGEPERERPDLGPDRDIAVSKETKPEKGTGLHTENTTGGNKQPTDRATTDARTKDTAAPSAAHAVTDARSEDTATADGQPMKFPTADNRNSATEHESVPGESVTTTRSEDSAGGDGLSSGIPATGCLRSEGTAAEDGPTPTLPATGLPSGDTTGAEALVGVGGTGGGTVPPVLSVARAEDAAVEDASPLGVAAAGRRWRTVQLGACAAMLAVAMTAGAVVFGAVRDGGGVPVSAVSAVSAVSPGLLAGGDLDASISSLQAHLRSQPKDFDGWATLGLAYVEQARSTGDPSRYPQAEKALKRSLSLRPGNDEALSGRAALAAARHDFEGALKYADQALEQNPYSERALCSRIDALVELGRYADAEKAAQTADSRRPGVPVFTRYAYVHELRGDTSTARRVLEQALTAATTPGDIAYVATQLGQLAWNQGEYDTALTHYARALAADENYLPALEGRARAQAASGRQAEAIGGLEAVVARYPLPGPLVALGELYEARGTDGDQAKAENQYALVDAWTALARANGVDADLDTALAAADHGDRTAALRAAQAEWARRHTVHTADALAWALHVNGRDAEALTYARQATATGYRNATFLYHRGIVERATGHPKDARTHLTAALKLNPGFSPPGARAARTALRTPEANQ